ncbi:MAG TPA: hypothetical protein DEO83_00875 [Lachnospiraceae bacterium]|nr:hypothetical protein [Lachnospiraceae bacterium]
MTFNNSKAAEAPNAPETNIDVEYITKKVSDVTLPEGWNSLEYQEQKMMLGLLLLKMGSYYLIIKTKEETPTFKAIICEVNICQIK